MSAKTKVLQVLSGWKAVELVLLCIVYGLWQIMQLVVKRLWKGHRRKLSKNYPPYELTVDSSIGTHCYIKVMGVKYHYVETGPKYGKIVLILGDAPDTDNLWGPNWSSAVRKLAETGHHVITLDLRGTGGSEGGCRSELSPPRAMEELTTLMEALGVSESNPAVVIGIGIGGMLTWYLAHCHGSLLSKFAVIGAPHPNLHWQYPPAAFCQKALHFIQWPWLPERWLANGELRESEEGRWSSSRACDWSGALNYVRGAAWWQIDSEHRASPAALLVGAQHSAAQLVLSAHHCARPTLRLVREPNPAEPDLPPLLLDFLIEKETEKISEELPRTLMGRMLEAVADRGRVLTARLTLPPAPVQTRVTHARI